MTSIIIASNMIVVAFDTLLLILFLYLAIAAIRLVFRKNYKGAAKLGGLVALAVVLALIADMPNLYISYHYCPVKILDLEINRVDHHPLGR